MKLNKKTYLLGGLFIIAIITRFYLLGYLPRGVNFDEAMGAVDAYALSLYGTDRFGTSLPVHFRAWEYGQMSVFMGYLQAICIKLFGFNTTTIRIPIALLSIFGMVAIYKVCNKFASTKVALLTLFLVIISPWHLLQSRWALDCNAFPHIFLIAFALLLFGITSSHPKRNWLIYASMLFWGLTFYCYGIAVYSVPLFLFFAAIYFLIKKKIQIKELIICIIIFLIVAIWEIMVMSVNFFEWDTITTPLFTIERFSESVRSNDILFFKFSLEQFIDNCKNFFSVLFIQPPEAGWNNVAKYGSIYPISGVFGILGLTSVILKLRKKDNTFYVTLLLYLLTAAWIGITTKEVNVNRVNLIFYPWLICVAIGIDSVRAITAWMLHKIPIKKLHKNDRITKISTAFFAIVVIGYSILGAAFFRLYFLKYEMKYGDSCFNSNYMAAMKYVDDLEDYDSIYITVFTGYGATDAGSEILMNYVAKHDAHYMQGKTNISNNREYIPYQERYHYLHSWDENETELAEQEKNKGYRTCFLVHENELELIDMSYAIIHEIHEFKIIEYLAPL